MGLKRHEMKRIIQTTSVSSASDTGMDSSQGPAVPCQYLPIIRGGDYWIH